MILGLLVALSAGAPTPARALPLERQHLEALARLAEPIAECIGQPDTNSPAFHGCYDWHSAVHANLAVRIIARLAGQPGYRLSADEIASTDNIAAEHALLDDGLLEEELPYGYAWLLLLDLEAGRADIHAMAVDAAAAVRAWLGSRLDSSLNVTASRYTSSTFPAYALHRWYSGFEPAQASQFAQQAAPRLLAQREAACSAEPRRPGFLDPCASLLLALSQMAADGGVGDAAIAEMARVVAARPIVRAATLSAIFEAGLNFTRAWALYAAADVTGDATLVARADRLFGAQLAQPEIWREGYADYSHWVAQFGVYALDLRSRVGPISGPSPTPPASPVPLPIPLPPIPLPPRPNDAPHPWGPWQVAPSVWAY